MTCDKNVGVKNILLTFRDCDSGAVIGPISHQLATEDLPTVKTCTKNNEALPGGFFKETEGYGMMNMNVIRDLRIPLAWYQGCSNVDAQIEYKNGLVYTGTGGGAVESEESDTHQVDLKVVFDDIDELLPPGALAA